MRYQYEGLTFNATFRINNLIKRLVNLKNKGLITEKEMQYSFLTGLQKLNLLTEKEIFDVYTNTTIEIDEVTV